MKNQPPLAEAFFHRKLNLAKSFFHPKLPKTDYVIVAITNHVFSETQQSKTISLMKFIGEN
jgi:hypothetical protein